MILCAEYEISLCTMNGIRLLTDMKNLFLRM